MATVRELLDIARGELGYKETPANSNRTKYGAWYGLDGQPWCVMFVEWVFAQASVKLPIETASCTILMNAAKSAGNWVTSNYQTGDVVIYDWGGDKRPDPAASWRRWAAAPSPPSRATPPLATIATGERSCAGPGR